MNKIKLNDYVEAGQAIAHCGNSGYSPVPHIHIQAQKSYILGDETVPFNFALYISDDAVKMQDKPQKGERIESVEYNDELFKNLYFTIGAVYEYDVFVKDKRKSKVKFKVERSRDLSGLLFLEDEKGSKLYFSMVLSQVCHIPINHT